MTIPDPLVDAAAEAMVNAGVWDETALGSTEDLARAALAAAFAILPDCPGVHFRQHSDSVVDRAWQGGWEACLDALSGLAENP